MFLSCKQLDGESTYLLVDDCKTLKPLIEGELLPLNKEKGLHYVNVDTVNCVLNVRFDKSLDSLSWLGDSLEALGYLPLEIVDTTQIAVDSLKADTLVVKEPVKKVVTVVEEVTKEVLEKPTLVVKELTSDTNVTIEEKVDTLTIVE